ncbi:Uu.00g058500.m01.CDS01 [Anthostomella pinea]|uniref:separase n=1 Tax=Anthostomella pinea TaxID=933095 RepID=A0AAI8YME1_9PEZI|nr:Uu.00g058500.m01.CDS01 [Anthostomella pinea]
MASSVAQVEAVRSAVTSTSTCTPTISATLKELLQGREDNNPIESSRPVSSRTGKAAQAAARSKTPTAARRGAKTPTTTTASQAKRGNGAILCPKEKAALATQIINATLRALGEAAKVAATSTSSTRSPAKGGKAKSATRTALRRSNSVPMTPLQPRSLNRVSTSPSVARTCRSPSSLSSSTGCLATVECARVAFTTLRSLQSSGAVNLPDLQFEAGMSSFVSKLIALNLFDLAVKELRILKRRLEGMAAGKGARKTMGGTSVSSTTSKTLSDLLDYPKVTASGPLLGFIITTQLQALRIIHGLKKLTHLGAALPFLQESNPSSPSNLLLRTLEDERQDHKKCSKQLESLSLLLLSLSPSLAVKDDAVAQEPRLNPSPETCLDVQVLGLTIKLQAWRISGHKGDVDKDILLPLSKCLEAFSRRTSIEKTPVLCSAFSRVWDMIEKSGLRTSGSSRSHLAAICQLLATASRESGNVKEARKWSTMLRNMTNTQEDSVARCCAVTAQVLALSLRESSEVDESLLVQVLDWIQGSFSGSVTDLDDLLVNICLLRKAAVNTLMQPNGSTTAVQQKPRQLLETFIFQLPRFISRWLGKPPASSSATKDVLRFEQRRQLLSGYLQHVLDSALMLAKMRLDNNGLDWETMESILPDILGLLDNMADIIGLSTKINPSASYHVKISQLYYQQHLALRKSATKAKESLSLSALRRSVDCLKSRPDAEQTRAQLLVKWERYADLCKASGRREKAADAFRSIRDHLARQEVVEVITATLATQPITSSWRSSVEAELLSRTVCSLAKLDRQPHDWTWLLVGMDKATALEHDFYFIIANDSKNHQELDLSNPTISAMLQLYNVEDYPIRRLRTFLQLLMANIDTRVQTDTLWAEAEEALDKIGKASLGSDAGLARYVPHLRALASCISGLMEGDLDSAQIRTGLSEWQLLVSNCQSSEELSQRIDNPQQLLRCLQSLADFARVKGFQSLLTDFLELSTKISQLTTDGSVELRISHSTALCLHYLSLGRSVKARKALQSNEEFLPLPELSQETVTNFHLSAAEYHLAVGAFDKSEQHLVEARAAAMGSSKEQPLRTSSHSSRKMLTAYASFLHSKLALERGDSHHALQFATTAVKILFHDWMQLEELRSSGSDVSMEDVSHAQSSEDESSLNSSRLAKFDQVRANTGPEFWTLVYPLYRFISRLSSTYAHLGMYQETVYYAEQAHKVASSMAPSYIAQSSAWLASVSLMAGKLDKAVELAAEAKPMIFASEPTFNDVDTICRLASIYRENNDPETEALWVAKAESMLEQMRGADHPADCLHQTDLESDMAKLSIKETVSVKVGVRATKAVRTTKVTSKTVSKKTVARVAGPPVEVQAQTKEEDTQLGFLRASISQVRSIAMLQKEKWTAAIAALRPALQLPKLSTDVSHERFLMGMSLIGQSLEQMGRDSVFTSIQDSTLSFPSVARDKTASDRASIGRVITPPRKGRSAVQDAHTFVENLREAQDHLLEAHSVASLNGDGNLVHRIATALQNVTILLSNTNPSKSAIGHPAHATCSVELARNLIWRRERKTLRQDHKAAWPTVKNTADARRCSLGFPIDVNHFQKEFVDIIPRSWNVVSVSLSDNKHDLCITKLQAGHSPFAIRLPLERASARDADSEAFDFQQGRSELLDIIGSANRSCHAARDMSQKKANSAWWAEREALDERMKDLLENIEQTWLGGFKGMFAQHHRRSDLLARFQKSFQNILDKHLPSRRQVRGRRTKAPVPKIHLDPRILELFINLGDATAPECDFDEALNDLLYFVVDVLQFHGERNAYDEIEFDSMVIDTFDALHAYHDAVQNTKDEQGGVHTILILDKALHIFPWESLPCLQGLPVSRVPSLACLRRSIKEQAPPRMRTRTPNADSDSETDELSVVPRHRDGHYASINSGTYILNPSADLTNTQATFGKALASLPPAWASVEGRVPTEPEFERALQDADLLLYFGHGSGAQYVRQRTIRRMDKCRAVALLMGCSSASLISEGTFEPHGTVWNYMLAGSPAVVGTLWDVTDRDIDRFAGRVFEEWGLMPRGTFAAGGADDVGGGGRGKGKGKAVAKPAARKKAGKNDQDAAAEERQNRTRTQTQTSLVEAVARARTEACKFKYLTAAAVCAYGIPVYIDK